MDHSAEISSSAVLEDVRSAQGARAQKVCRRASPRASPRCTARLHPRNGAGSTAPHGSLAHRDPWHACPLCSPPDDRTPHRRTRCLVNVLGLAELADRTRLEPGGWSIVMVEEAKISTTTEELREELSFLLEDEGAGSARVFSEHELGPALVDELARLGPEDVALLPRPPKVAPVSRALDYGRACLAGRASGVIVTSEASVKVLAVEAPNFWSWVGPRVWSVDLGAGHLDVEARLQSLRRGHRPQRRGGRRPGRIRTLPLDPIFAEWLVLLGKGPSLATDVSSAGALARRKELQARLWGGAHRAVKGTRNHASGKGLHREILTYLINASDQRLLAEAQTQLYKLVQCEGPNREGCFDIAVGTVRNFDRTRGSTASHPPQRWRVVRFSAAGEGGGRPGRDHYL